MGRRYIDCFPMHDELDMLECRLYELETIPELVHVIVEAEVTHQDQPKPSYYLDNKTRFEKWADRIVHVWATNLPTAQAAPNPWARELAQRDWCAAGLKQLDPQPDDIILHGDIDEIPRRLHVVNLPRWDGLTAFGQRGLFWAVDWQYPHWWWGTVACNMRTLVALAAIQGRPFVEMRNRRNIPADPDATDPGGWAEHWPMPGTSTPLPDSGWHLSWLGGKDRAKHKLGSFCHPEVAVTLDAAIADDNRFYREGRHVDGIKLEPVDIDDTWPRYIVERRCPESWFRPR